MGEVELFDFRAPQKFAPDQLRRIERVHDVFCHTAAAALSGLVQGPTDVRLRAARQCALAQATPDDRSAVGLLLDLDPGGMPALLTIDGRLLMALMERMTGGSPGDETPVFEGEMTEIERSLSERVLTTLCEVLSGIWRDFQSVSLRPESFEIDLSAVTLGAANEPTLSVAFDCQFRGVEGAIALWVPWPTLETCAPSLGGRESNESHQDPISARAMAAHLKMSPVIMRAEAGRRKITLAEVVALKPGDLLPLHRPVDEGMILYANDWPIDLVIPGEMQHARAVQLARRLHEDPR